MLPCGIFEFVDLGNAISSILGSFERGFKRITEVRLLFRLSLHKIVYATLLDLRLETKSKTRYYRTAFLIDVP